MSAEQGRPVDGRATDDPADAGVTGARGAHRASWVLSVIVAVAFALFFAYDLFEAISNLIEVPKAFTANNEFYRQNGLDGLVVTPPWALLVANVALPPVAFGAAVLLGRKRVLWQFALMLLAALAVVASLTLTLTASVRG
ncbi:hypothetical protein ACPEEZ_09990 [Frigoribacterium sp. 2-23]|uniref:hypothetical protein n=1 Tax=Frigoribacterium sp. 2-23 TaxID=3415006 RepID=UPI003C6F98AA